MQYTLLLIIKFTSCIKLNSKKFLIVPFLLMFASNLGADTFTLAELLQQGFSNNYGIKLVKIEEEIVTNSYTLGNAGYLPTIDLAAGINNNHANTHTESLDGTENRVYGNRTAVGSLGAYLNWTLFDGFKTQTIYNKLEGQTELAQIRTRQQIENYASELIAEYYNLVQQKIRLRNLNSALALSRERLRIVESRYNIGLASGLDLSQARADFNADSSVMLQQELSVRNQ